MSWGNLSGNSALFVGRLSSTSELIMIESIILASMVIAALLLASLPDRKSDSSVDSSTLVKENYTISALEHAVLMQKSANDALHCYKKLLNSTVFGASQSEINQLERELAEALQRHCTNSYEFTMRLKKVKSKFKLRSKVR